jgi:hypothetical protein
LFLKLSCVEGPQPAACKLVCYRNVAAKFRATERLIISGGDDVAAFAQAGSEAFECAVLMRAAALDEEGVDL